MKPTHACKLNPVYPKTRLHCGEIHRIESKTSLPERWDGDWLLLEYLQR